MGANAHHHIGSRGDIGIADLRDDVARLKSCLRSGGRGANSRDVGTLIDGQGVALGDLGVDGRRRHPELRMRRRLAVDDLLRDVHGVVDRDGEPNARRSARGGGDEGIHPDELPIAVDKRTARIAGVDRSIGLDHVRVNRRRFTGIELGGGAARRRDDARRHRLLEPEGTADGHDPFAYRQIVGRADLDRGQVGRIDLENRQIARFIGANDACLVFGTRSGHLKLLCALDDMVVRQDVAIR